MALLKELFGQKYDLGDVGHIDGLLDETGEDTQIVTVHRGGKTFQERRRKAKAKLKLGLLRLPADQQAKARGVLNKVVDRAKELAVKLTPAAMKVGEALGVVFDAPSDFQKFAYNPTLGAKVPTNDFVHASFGVSGHLVATVAAHVLSRAVMWAKKRLSGDATEAADAGLMEFAEFVVAVYAAIAAELGLDSPLKAEDVAETLEGLLRGKS